VLVENAGFGASNAAPVARKVLDTYLLGPDGKLKPPTLEAAAPRPQAPGAAEAGTAGPPKPQA
jgi:penicillin-binding protein 2